MGSDIMYWMHVHAVYFYVNVSISTWMVVFDRNMVNSDYLRHAHGLYTLNYVHRTREISVLACNQRTIPKHGEAPNHAQAPSRGRLPALGAAKLVPRAPQRLEAGGSTVLGAARAPLHAQGDPGEARVSRLDRVCR